jgi:hypothetical protein
MFCDKYAVMTKVFHKLANRVILKKIKICVSLGIESLELRFQAWLFELQLQPWLFELQLQPWLLELQ